MITNEFKRFTYLVIGVAIPLTSVSIALFYGFKFFNQEENLPLFCLVYAPFCFFYAKYFVDSNIDLALRNFIFESNKNTSIYVGLFICFTYIAFMSWENYFKYQ
jgi:hypothetical protein